MLICHDESVDHRQYDPELDVLYAARDAPMRWLVRDRVGARRAAPLLRWLMAGIGLGQGISASAPP
jgi:hypothetical protein